MVRHTIRLVGPGVEGGRVPIELLQVLTETLLEAAQRSTRLRVEGRSNLHGKGSWLKAATNIRLVGIRSGSTILELEAPELGSAAPAIFQQLALWEPSINREQSALSLVEEALGDALAGNTNSDLLDRRVLNSFASFSRTLASGIDEVILNGTEPCTRVIEITRDGLRTAERLRKEAPAPQRVAVSGQLDQLTGSKRAFQLRLPAGQRLRGVLPPGDPSEYAPLFTQNVVVYGDAIFRPSGVLSRIEASSIRPAGPADVFFERIPIPNVGSHRERKPRAQPPLGTTLGDQVFGHWPGDETDEEILRALEELS